MAANPLADWNKIYEQLLHLLGAIGKPTNQIGSHTPLLGGPPIGFTAATLQNFLTQKVTPHFHCNPPVRNAHIAAPKLMMNLVDAIIAKGGVQQ